MDLDNLDKIIRCLKKHRQRATYAAVAGLVGSNAQSVMRNREVSELNSWVVSKRRGKPTGYPSSHVDKHLEDKPHVISEREELERWMEEYCG